jgi:hypothetical protein
MRLLDGMPSCMRDNPIGPVPASTDLHEPNDAANWRMARLGGWAISLSVELTGLPTRDRSDTRVKTGKSWLSTRISHDPARHRLP